MKTKAKATVAEITKVLIKTIIKLGLADETLKDIAPTTDIVKKFGTNLATVMEIAMDLEEEYGVNIEDEQIALMYKESVTPQTFTDFINNKLKQH